MSRALLALSLLLPSCEQSLPQAGHVVVWLDTDAPVPTLIDSARVEVRTVAGAVLDAREIGLDEERLRRGLSFVVAPNSPERVPASEAGVVVHVVMWRASTGRASPVPSESLEGWFSLPAAPAEGARDVTLALQLDALGAARGSPEQPVPAPEGHSASRVSTWPPAVPRACNGAPREGEVCIPGGAFWMGHPLLGNVGFASAGQARLVVLSPFFLDVNDVTVADYRRDGKVYAGRWTGSYAGSDEKDHCTFTDAPSDHDGLPLNCVRSDPAREFCRSLGKDLPTEAQLEYVATNFGRGLYPWGDERPACEDAVFGRGGSAALAGFPRTCAPTGTSPRERLGSPEPVVRASYGRDLVRLPDGSEVHDLVGNVAKWTLDRGSLEHEPCWQPRSPNVWFDPLCEQASSTFPKDSRSTRGTGFYMAPVPAPWRGTHPDGAFSELGFRCARRAE